LSQPFGFFDFVKLEKNARLVISDSGTVQEECCIFGVPAITIRETTERQETIECGSNILSGTKYENIINAFEAILKRDNKWIAPADYLVENVSDIVINILLGRR
jgi:UDP-N-acetylglucosamine 2-epimerase (non-hydrolysing)